MKTTKTTLFTTTVLALTAASMSAQVILEDSFSFTTGDDLAAYSFDAAALNTTGASKIAITTGTEGDGNTQGTGFSSITFGNAALTKAHSGGGGNGTVEVWYLDLAGVTLDNTTFSLTVTGDVVQEGLGFGAYALSGTANGFSATGSSGGGNTATVTTLTDNEFAVATFARNNFDDGGGVGVQSPLTELFYSDLGGFSVASASTVDTLDGTTTLGVEGDYDLSIANNSNGTGEVIAVSFAAVPEPSTLALLGFSLCGLLLRRRR